MLVQSFSQYHAWFSDFAAFANALGIEAQRDEFARAARPSPCPLWIGWVTGEARRLLAGAPLMNHRRDS